MSNSDSPGTLGWDEDTPVWRRVQRYEREVPEDEDSTTDEEVHGAAYAPASPEGVSDEDDSTPYEVGSSDSDSACSTILDSDDQTGAQSNPPQSQRFTTSGQPTGLSLSAMRAPNPNIIGRSIFNAPPGPATASYLSNDDGNDGDDEAEVPAAPGNTTNQHHTRPYTARELLDAAFNSNSLRSSAPASKQPQGVLVNTLMFEKNRPCAIGVVRRSSVEL